MANKQLKIFLFVLAMTLTACLGLDKNPLLGTWVPNLDGVNTANPAEEFAKGLAQSFLGNVEITFTEQERITKGPGINKVSKVQYKKIAANEWIVSDDGGKNWETITVIDENTIVIADKKAMQLKRKSSEKI